MEQIDASKIKRNLTAPGLDLVGENGPGRTRDAISEIRHGTRSGGLTGVFREYAYVDPDEIIVAGLSAGEGERRNKSLDRFITELVPAVRRLRREILR